MYRFVDSISVLVAESRWNLHLNPNVIHSCWVVGLMAVTRTLVPWLASLYFFKYCAA